MVPSVAGDTLSWHMLGLGDIVLPGLVVAYVQRFDMYRPNQPPYYWKALAAYVTARKDIAKHTTPALLGCISNGTGLGGVRALHALNPSTSECGERGDLLGVLTYAHNMLTMTPTYYTKKTS